MTMRALQWLFGLVLGMSATAAGAQDFDHMHAAWDGLLRKHVRWIGDGNATRVDYRGFAADRAPLRTYLEQLSAVSPAQYAGWSKPRQYAFLVNAYNAFTVELILTRYPHLQSIKDLGSLLQSPWKRRFFHLLGEERHLDWIEHERLRAPGVFDDPRVHVAVNCASIGCPALADRAFVAERLDARLDELFGRFLADRSRNRYNPAARVVELSSIFDWYGEDFRKGHKGFTSLQDVVAGYADQLADSEADRNLLRGGKVPVRFLSYDWSLNDLAR